MPDEPDKIDMIFSLAPGTSMAQAKGALEAADVEIGELLDELGTIIGKGSLSELEKLRGLPHFESVDLDSPVSIAPPDSPVQ